MARQARCVFADALALYDIRNLDAKQLVSAATQLLVDGIENDAVVALACQTVTSATSPFELDELVVRAREELGMTVLDHDARLLRVAQAMVRSWGRGEVDDRELASWAHSLIGHQGPDVVERLVIIDDVFDCLECTSETPESIHQNLVRIAAELSAMADPWE